MNTEPNPISATMAELSVTALRIKAERDQLLARIELCELEVEYSAKKVVEAKQLLEEVLTIREMGPNGPLKTKIRAFLKSITRE